MFLVPLAESLLVMTIPCKVVRCTTHKTLAFLTLEMVHRLGHVHAQTFYLIKLRHFQLMRLGVWQELLFLKSGHPSSWHRISPVLIPVDVCGPRTVFLRAWRLPHLQLPCKGIQGVETSPVHLIPFGKVHHGEAKCIMKAGQQTMIKPISPQVLSLI